MPDNDFTFAYFFARRHAKRWKPRERTRPKMASAAWRFSALACTIIGALGAWLVFRNSGALGWRVFAGGVVGFVIGMYVVETIWERRLRSTEPAGPIGPRR